MLITARANNGPARERGVIGHARSSDLVHWSVEPPLSVAAGFGHLEVPQVAVIDGDPVLLFCSNAMGPSREGANDRIWTATGPTVLGPWDVVRAQPFSHPSLYAPRLVCDLDGSWALIGFLDQVDSRFVGELTDPITARYSGNAGLTVVGGLPGQHEAASSAAPIAF